MLAFLLFGCQADKLSCGEGTVLSGDECVLEESLDTGTSIDTGGSGGPDTAEDTADTGDVSDTGDTADTSNPDDTGDAPDPVERHVIGYFAEWGVYGRDYQVEDIPADKLTHINYAFANPTKELCTDGVDNDQDYPVHLADCADPDCANHTACGGTQSDDDIPWECKVYDPWASYLPDGSGIQNYQKLQSLKSQHPHLKTLISLGGWTLSGNFSDISMTADSRSGFIDSCVQFMLTHGFDGIDVDWEYPGGGGLGSNTARPEDTENFTLLLAEFRQALDAQGDYLLTIAAPAAPSIISNMELPAIAEHLDWINVMAYDYYGAWDLSATNHNSPTNWNSASPIADDQYLNVTNTMQIYQDSGIPAHQLVLGVPFYGRGYSGVTPGPNGDGLYQSATSASPGTWEAGVLDYSDIVQNYESNSSYGTHFDPVSGASYLFSESETIFISYDTAEVMMNKMDLIEASGFGGAMFWELSSDHNDELLDILNTIR